MEAHGELFRADPVALKTLAYTYEAQNRLEKAHEVYKAVLKLRPGYAQSYIDLSNSYYALNAFEKSYALLIRYSNMAETTPDHNPKRMATDLDTLLGREALAIAAKLPEKQDTSGDPEVGNTRLFFTWSDAEAEFDLQFVNPGNQYYTWTHGLESDGERIFREKMLGYTTREYMLDDALPGNWSVRCTYYGNKKLSPTYMKLYIYRNFGLPTQSREVHVFRLNLRDVRRQLITFNIPDRFDFNALGKER